MFFGSEWRNPEISSFSLFLILFLFHVFQNFHDLSVFYKNSLGKQSTSPIYDTNKVQNDEKVQNLVFVPSSLAKGAKLSKSEQHKCLGGVNLLLFHLKFWNTGSIGIPVRSYKVDILLHILIFLLNNWNNCSMVFK